jgi:hypothetical protein
MGRTRDAAFSVCSAISALILVFTAAPVVTMAQDSTAAIAMPVFEVDATWPKLPNNWVIGDPSSIAVDRHDNVWILHRPRTVPAEKKDHAAPPVLEFDKHGKFLQAWGGPPGKNDNNDQWEWPDTEHGIYVDYKDNVWIGGNNPNTQIRVSQRSDDMLLKFSSKGKLIKQIGRRDQSQGNKDTTNLHQPADVQVIQKTNEAVVADGYGNRRIIVLDAETGAFKRLWGAFGNEPIDVPPPAARGGGPAPTPAPRDLEGPGPPQWGIVHAVRIANDGLVYVADRGNSRVQVFTLDGKYQTQVFVNRTDKSAATACGLALSSDPQQKYLYVSDFGNGHIWILDRKALRVLGHFGEQGPEPGNFRNAHHMATDSAGNLYTAEVNPGSRVQKFNFKGVKPRE